MLRLCIVLIGLFINSMVSAQMCGTLQEPLLERTDENKRNMIPLQRGIQKYIPVTFHLVAAANGSGRVSEEALLQQIANLNLQYADQEALFYIDRFNYFDNDAVYNTPASNAAKVQMRLRKDNNSINIFITNSAENGGGSPGTVLAYYDQQEDWIVSKRGEINGATNTLAHELGHFFSLAHPFSGWDCNPYTLDDYTNPVNVQFTIPCEGGGGSALIELHNRSNCTTAGDRICDTPEDYNLGLLYQNDCSENNSIKDLNGEVIKPMVNNFMSYYRDCATYEFTPTQKNLINTDFFSIQRSYIRSSNVPNQTPIVDLVQYITPINGQESNSASNILLDWEDTPGANKYLLIYDRFASFTFNPKKVIVTSSQYVIPETLTDNVTYYWKVWPFNESITGAGYSEAQNFLVGTGVGINDIHAINDYAIQPNPVSDHMAALLTLSSSSAFLGNLEITDAAGHVLSKDNIEVPSGMSQFVLQTTDLPIGIYFVVLNSEKGRLVERLLILE